MPRRVVLWLPLGLAAALSGCFTYTAVDRQMVSAQEEVRVRLTTAAAIRIGPHLGNIAENWEGRLTPAGSDSLDLAVWIGRDYIGSPFENARQRVLLGHQEIVEIRRRKLSVTRTSLVTAGVLAATALLINRVAFEADRDPVPGTRQPPPPEPEGMRALRAVR